MTKLPRERRTTIEERCARAMTCILPSAAPEFFAGDADRFRQPVSATVRDELRRFIDDLVEGRKTPGSSFRETLRIAAVQEVAPSAALGFLLEVRKVLREELAGLEGGVETLARVEARIDRELLDGLDFYVECREKIHAVRLREARAEAERLARLVRAMSKGEEAE